MEITYQVAADVFPHAKCWVKIDRVCHGRLLCVSIHGRVLDEAEQQFFEAEVDAGPPHICGWGEFLCQ